jgi:hypothetical protein
MSIGITNFNSKALFTNSLSIGNDEQLKIDQYGHLNTSANVEIDGTLVCKGELNITTINSSNSSISINSAGNCLLNGTIYTKDNATFTNNLYLRNNNNQIILNISTANNSYSYLNISPTSQRVGFGTTVPKYFFHVAGEVYNENTIINKKLVINPDNLTKQNTEEYELSVGGNINITGGLYINGTQILPSKLNSLSDNLNSTIANGSIGGGSGNIGSNTIGNGSHTINGVKIPTWTSINSQLYYTKGFVGIGTNNPTYQLEVNGNTLIDGQSIYLNGNVIYNGTLLDDAMTGLWDKNTDNSFLIYTAFNTNSKVGIGIKEPQYKLDLVGDFHVTDNIVADKNIYITNNLGVGTNDPQYKLDVNGDLRVSGNFYINGKKYEEVNTQNIYWMETVNTNNIYFLNKVGIQVSNPQYDLHVKGSVYIEGNSFLNGPTGITELNIENQFTFNSDKIIIKNSTGDLYSKGLIYCNNIYGDTSSRTKIIENNIEIMTFTPNSKLYQVKSSFTSNFNGIGTSNNGMIFSDNGTLFATIVPFGTDTNSNGTSIYNGIVQTYNWDNISKKWYINDNIISSNLLGGSLSTSYTSSISCNSDGNFIAVSSHTIVDYKVIFYILDTDKKWNFINFIEIPKKIDAGKYMIMSPDIKYLFLSEDKDNIELYVNENQDITTNFDANFKKGTLNLSSNNNIGVISDLKSNHDCTIMITSSFSGASPTIANNGTIACYAFWNSTGNPSILSATPFIRLGKNIKEHGNLINVDSKKKSYFGYICAISTHANIDFKNGNVSDFEYDITIAASTGGHCDPNNTPAHIKIYKFKYNTDNSSSGLVYPNSNLESNIPYIDGTWDQIGYIDHVTYKSESGFGSDIKFNNDGTTLFVGSPIENNIYIFNYKAVDKSWNKINIIQGFKSGDMDIGYRLAYNYNHNHFATSSFKYANSDIYDSDSYNYLGVSKDSNHIRVFNIEYNSSSSTF